jgi:periplasmic copper chaperone A
VCVEHRASASTAVATLIADAADRRRRYIFVVEVARRSAALATIAATLAATALLSACAAGQQAQTANVTGVNDAVDADAGAVAVRAFAVAAPSGGHYAKGGSAQLIGVLVNTGQRPDELTSITSPAFTGWSSTSTGTGSATPLAAGSATPVATSGSSGQRVQLPVNSAVSYGVPDATGTLQVTGLKSALFPGDEIKVTFTFQRAGAVTAEVPVKLTATPGSAVVGATPSSPPGAGAASEPPSS